jgi:hypothetical protein
MYSIVKLFNNKFTSKFNPNLFSCLLLYKGVFVGLVLDNTLLQLFLLLNSKNSLLVSD